MTPCEWGDRLTMLNGLIDLHVHTSPDERLRRLDDFGLARIASEMGAAGVVLKGHRMSTVLRARAAEAAVPSVRVMGGIVLNSAVGGLDPRVVAEACRQGARIIWLPTLDAANHFRHENKSGGIVVAPGGKLAPALREIISIVASHDVALATGHISPEEIRVVAEAAVEKGVRRIIINHPEHRVTALSLDQQRQLLRDFPVYFERCYAQPAGSGRYVSNLATNLEAIQAIGSDSTVLATDSGQLECDPWDQAWHTILSHHSTHGVSPKAMDRMTRINPGFLSGMKQSLPPMIPLHSSPASAPRNHLP